jgi:uncharacterized membrane protein YeaQ/YmgE (transglycosylase-associated protein family)
MTLSKDLNDFQNGSGYPILILISAVIGAYLFFYNTQLTEIYKSIVEDDPYVFFSQNIFKQNYSYISESILLPLIAKLLGSSVSYQTYLTLCAFVMVLILPLIVYFSQYHFHNAKKSFLLILLFAATFPFLYKYWLGFPDPLTIILLAAPVFLKRQNLIFLAAFFAGLSHFSMAAIALVGYVVLLFFSKQYSKSSDSDSIKSILTGLVCAKILLWMWYLIFEYHLNSRLDIVFKYGLDFFIEQHNASASGFWLTPGVPFLALYFCIFLYFIYVKRVFFSLAMLVPLSLSYLAVFFTIDGLRIFAVTISSAYVFVLREFVNAVYPAVHKIFLGIKLSVERVFTKSNYKNIYLSCGLIIATFWCFGVDRAKSKGLLVNELPLLLNTMWSISYYDIGLFVAGGLIFVTIAIPAFRQNMLILNCAKAIFIFPILLIILQYSRSFFFPNQIFTFWIKLTIALLLLFLVLGFLKVKILELLDYFNYQINKAVRFFFL